MKAARIFTMDYQTGKVKSEAVEQPVEQPEETITTPKAEILVTVYLPDEYGKEALEEVLNTFEAGLRGMEQADKA